jgi:hypothetical protein
VVNGAGEDLVVVAPHPYASAPIVGTNVSGWHGLTDMVRTANRVFAGRGDESQRDQLAPQSIEFRVQKVSHGCSNFLC